MIPRNECCRVLWGLPEKFGEILWRCGERSRGRLLGA